MVSDVGGSDPFVGTVEDRAARLMVSDPALVRWLMVGGATPGAVAGGPQETTAQEGGAPAAPVVRPGLLLEHKGRPWAVHTIDDAPLQYRVEETVFVWVNLLLARTAENDQDPFNGD